MEPAPLNQVLTGIAGSPAPASAGLPGRHDVGGIHHRGGILSAEVAPQEFGPPPPLHIIGTDLPEQQAHAGTASPRTSLFVISRQSRFIRIRCRITRLIRSGP